MTYDARERSADLGAPIELYEFIRGVTRYRYTSADRDYTLNLNVYEARTIARSQVEATADVNRQGLRITAPRDLPVADLYRVSPPSEPVLVVISQIHDGDPDAQTAVIWQGRVVGVDWQRSEAVINCESVHTSLRRAGLRRAWQRNCPHVLYSSGLGQCNAQREAFRVQATITGINGVTLSASAFGAQPTGYFDGGYVEAVVGGFVVRRAITAHGPTSIDVDQTIPGLQAGAVIDVYPGCDHTTGANGCTKFNNVVNYGGALYLPTKNPFAGDPVY